MTRSDLQPKEKDGYFSRYIDIVPDVGIHQALEMAKFEMLNCILPLSEEQWSYRYEEGKWNLKELIQHLIDTERIFCNRALRFARGENQPLPGYDENLFADNSKADNRDRSELLVEYKIVRESSILLFNSFDDEQLRTLGEAGGNTLSVRAIAYLNAGHDLHHLRVFKERYLKIS